MTIAHSTDKHGSDGSARVKFKGLITKSLLCVRCKAEGALRAVRAQCAYPVLSAKRRHQLRHVDHRVGGAEGSGSDKMPELLVRSAQGLQRGVNK